MVSARPPRLTRRLAVSFSTSDSAVPRSGCTVDLSAGGLFLNTRALLTPGAHVLGRLSLPGGGTCEVHGVVAWHRRAPRAIDAVARGGLGLRLVWADPGYFAFLAGTA